MLDRTSFRTALRIPPDQPHHTRHASINHTCHTGYLSGYSTGAEQTVHGYFHLLGGPGLVSMSPEVSNVHEISTLDGGVPRRTSARCESCLRVATKHRAFSLSFTGANLTVSGASPVIVDLAES